jgi:tRNA 2-selenouridine synthase
MPIEKIDIGQFLAHSLEIPVLDVRSPGEYRHAHMPGAISLPLFTDEERAVIGTAYVKESRQAAVDHGLRYFSGRMKDIAEEAIRLAGERKDTEKASAPPAFLIHCWRGGMRSEAVAWLLHLYGYRIYLLKGGYKAFRRWALSQFEKNYSLKILGGYTGSGKTDLLEALQRQGKPVIDLEGLACHKGSAFGSLGNSPQPSHEMFENLLAIELWKLTRDHPDGGPGIWIEDESVHIGTVGIPKNFWQQMRSGPLYFLDIPFDQRLQYISKTYGVFSGKELEPCVLKIQKRLGGLQTKNVLRFLSENNHREAFAILLSYYDRMYADSLHNRENFQSLLNKVTCCSVDISNAEELAHF